MEEQTPISIIHNIFIDFFGEDNVDLQQQDIIVHFPKVTVTNENNKSVDITHLWAKIKVQNNGTINGTFQLIRSELTLKQFISGYSHSHINVVSPNNFNIWRDPCLGRGPLRNTIASLSTDFSKELWELFCFELSKYVTVESLEGVPFIRLETIGVNRDSNKITFPLEYQSYINDNPNYTQIISNFIPYILKKRPFGFNFVNGSYGIAMSDRNIFITLSNLFIEWYNSLPKVDSMPSKKELFDQYVIFTGKAEGINLYYLLPVGGSYEEYVNCIGRELFTFKGKPVLFNVTNDSLNQNDQNASVFLSKTIVTTIVNRILKTLNNKYGQLRNQIQEDSVRTAQRYL